MTYVTKLEHRYKLHRKYMSFRLHLDCLHVINLQKWVQSALH